MDVSPVYSDLYSAIIRSLKSPSFHTFPLYEYSLLNEPINWNDPYEVRFMPEYSHSPKRIRAKSLSVYNMIRTAWILILLTIVVLLSACKDQDIQELRVTDLQQARISALKQYPNLRVLDLRGIDATGDTVDALSKDMPNVHILWRIKIGSDTFDNTVSSITLPENTTASDLNQLVYFDSLINVDGSNCALTKTLLEAASGYPEIAFTWNFAGQMIDETTTSLDLTGKTIDSAEALSQILRSHPRITTVLLTNADISNPSLSALYADHGSDKLERFVSIAGREESCWVNSLNLSGTSIEEAPAILAALSQFPLLKTVDLSGQPFSFELMDSFLKQYPDIQFDFSFQLFSKDISTQTESLDLSKHPFTTTAEVTAILQYLPNLKEVNMCDCGLTDAQMEELISTFPNTKFVWFIRIGGWKIRTDITAFSKGQRQKFRNGMGEFLGDGKTNFYSEDLTPLKYCKDLVFLDLGHGNRITDLSILENFPKLRGLVLSMNKITDITPIGQLKELESLEIYQNYITDVSPLAQLPKLKYLNLCRNSFVDVTPLMGMKQLKLLWMVHNDQIPSESKLALSEALPDCEVRFYGYSCGSEGWRENEVYKEYQRAFNLPTKP